MAMAMATISIPYILTLFLFLPCICTKLSANSTETATAKQNDPIQEVCSQVVWPAFCNETLKRYPGSATSDLPAIAKVSVDLALSHASTTKSLIKTLLKQARNPPTKMVFANCFDYFSSATVRLDAARNHLAAKDYTKANYGATLAQEYIYNCFITLDYDLSRELRDWTGNEYDYCNILCETSGLLMGGKDYACV